MKCSLVLCTAVVLLSGAPSYAEPICDTFEIQLSFANEFEGGSGSGWNDGEWIYYDETDWWHQWFYDHPPYPNRWKQISYEIGIGSTGGELDVADFVDVFINWTTPEFPSTGPDGPPPMPGDPADWIDRKSVTYAPRPVDERIGYSFSGDFSIPDYNPEWVSIDVRVTPGDLDSSATYVVSGWICHECIPEPSTFLLLSMGAVGLLAYAVRRRERAA